MAPNRILTGLALVLAPALAWCGPMRDPMLPPASPPAAVPSAAPRAAPHASAPAAAPEPAVRGLITVDGRRFVVDGSRRLGIGDLLAGARIERIEESAVWVRQGATLRRLPLYAGITKQPAQADPPADPASARGTR